MRPEHPGFFMDQASHEGPGICSVEEIPQPKWPRPVFDVPLRPMDGLSYGGMYRVGEGQDLVPTSPDVPKHMWRIQARLAAKGFRVISAFIVVGAISFSGFFW